MASIREQEYHCQETQLDIFERGRIATEQMNGIKAELRSNPAFIRARGGQMFDQGGKPRAESLTTFPALGGYLCVCYKVEGTRGLEEMILTWSDKINRIEEGNVEAILLRAFDYDHKRPDPRGQLGAITYRRHSGNGEDSQSNRNTQETVDAVVSFRATYFQKPI